jgi:hypothetical protein
LLTYAFETKKVVTIELIDSDNNDAIGFVEQINDKCCTVSMLNDYGEEDGVSILMSVISLTYHVEGMMNSFSSSCMIICMLTNG